jgi:hypothetical protein
MREEFKRFPGKQKLREYNYQTVPARNIQSSKCKALSWKIGWEKEREGGSEKEEGEVSVEMILQLKYSPLLM